MTIERHEEMRRGAEEQCERMRTWFFEAQKECERLRAALRHASACLKDAGGIDYWHQNMVAVYKGCDAALAGETWPPGLATPAVTRSEPPESWVCESCGFQLTPDSVHRIGNFCRDTEACDARQAVEVEYETDDGARSEPVRDEWSREDELRARADLVQPERRGKMNPDHAAFRALAGRWESKRFSFLESCASVADDCARELLALCEAPVARSATREQVGVLRAVGVLADTWERWATMAAHDGDSAKRLRIKAAELREVLAGRNPFGEWAHAQDREAMGSALADQPQPSEPRSRDDRDWDHFTGPPEPPRTEPADFERDRAEVIQVTDDLRKARLGERPRQSEPVCTPVGLVQVDAPGTQRAQSAPQCEAEMDVDKVVLTFDRWVNKVAIPSEKLRALLGTATPSPENVARARELLETLVVILPSWSSAGRPPVELTKALALLGGGDGSNG